MTNAHGLNDEHPLSDWAETVDAALPVPKTRRGRARSEALLDAAYEEFVSEGFERASLRRVVNKAGGSMETLYRLYGSKENLFRCVAAAAMNSQVLELSMRESCGEDVAAELRDWGIAYLTVFLRPRNLSFYRMMINEAAAMPETGRVLWEAGPASARAQVEDYLRRAMATGCIASCDPRQAAALYVDMIKGGLHLRALLTGHAPSTEEIESTVAAAAQIFTRGLQSQ